MSVGSQVGEEISDSSFEHSNFISSFQFQRGVNVQQTDRSCCVSYNEAIVVHLNDEKFSTVLNGPKKKKKQLFPFKVKW